MNYGIIVKYDFDVHTITRKPFSCVVGCGWKTLHVMKRSVFMRVFHVFSFD
jgi:hypothetical protein